MTKQAFLLQLRNGLSGLPQEDIEERLIFYSEMIDDRMEEGLSEEQAVLEIGHTDELISQIAADIPLTRLVKEKIVPRKKRAAWEIILIILSSPIWLSLLIAALAILLSLYAALWAVFLSLWAVFGSLVAAALFGIVAGIVYACCTRVLTGITTLSIGILCAGLSIFMFYGCLATTKGILLFTKKVAVWFKRRLIMKENTK